MFERMGASFRQFMAGRNGVDTLAWFWCILGIVLNLIGSFSRIFLFSLLAYIPLFLAVFRIFSRNTAKRYAENERFRQFFSRLRGMKTYCYYRCPACKTRVRVPRGKGKIRITCPACRESFIKKT